MSKSIGAQRKINLQAVADIQGVQGVQSTLKLMKKI